MFDLKVINSVLGELEEERGIPRAKVIDAIETALATAYKKEYGKRGQVIRATFDVNTGATEFSQVKKVVDETTARFEEAEPVTEPPEGAEPDERPYFNPEQHILLSDAKKIKRDAALGDELIFPLEGKGEYGRIAAQTAKQVIIQKIREAEKISILSEFGAREGEIVSGTVQRVERGNIFIDLGKAQGILPYEEQIPGERYKQGERIRAYLFTVEETPRGVFLRLSRSNPLFLEKLFELEVPELANKSIEVKAVAREAGSRSKIAVASKDPHIDPVGSFVGQRGVRVSTVMSELGGEKIDIIEWSADQKLFIEDALSPARTLSVSIDEAGRRATVEVANDQQSLAIGKGGQNVRLAAKLTGWRIDITSQASEQAAKEEAVAAADAEVATEQANVSTEEKIENPEAKSE